MGWVLRAGVHGATRALQPAGEDAAAQDATWDPKPESLNPRDNSCNPKHTHHRRPREKQAQADQKRAKFFQPEGDHLTLLATYEAWKAAKFSTPWAYENFVQASKRGQAAGAHKRGRAAQQAAVHLCYGRRPGWGLRRAARAPPAYCVADLTPPPLIDLDPIPRSVCAGA